MLQRLESPVLGMYDILACSAVQRSVLKITIGLARSKYRNFGSLFLFFHVSPEILKVRYGSCAVSNGSRYQLSLLTHVRIFVFKTITMTTLIRMVLFCTRVCSFSQSSISTKFFLQTNLILGGMCPPVSEFFSCQIDMSIQCWLCWLGSL